jgi:enoyl-CoA hydratase/carnithine racemase
MSIEEDTMPDTPVLVVREGHTTRIVLNRPDKKNALNDALLQRLLGALREAVAQDDVRSIVLTGQGDCFSSGRDIREFGADVALEDASLDRATEAFVQTLSLLIEAPKPTVAAVRGFALGGGQALTLACDFVVAERGARFGNVEMAYGFPAAMNIVLLSQHLGRRLGLEIAMSGELYTAERYRELGLINRLADPGALDRVTGEFVEMLNSRAPWAVRRTKETFRTVEHLAAAEGLHVGNQLNQLLRLASQMHTVHSQDSGVKAALKSAMRQPH